MDFPKLFQSAKAPDFTTAIAAIILVVLWIFFHRRQRKASSRLPPGPTPWPIVGNLFQLGRLPHLKLAHFANKYGPIFSLRMGSVPTIVVSSSAMAKVILKTQDSIFANRPKTATGKYYAYDYKDVAFSSYGPYWRQMKKLCMVEMFSAKRLESFTPILEEELTYALRLVWKESRCGERAVNLSEIILTVVEAHVWRILSGTSCDEYHLNESGKEIKELLLEMSHLAGSLNIGEFIPWLDWLDLGGIERGMRMAQQSFDKVASKILEDHKERRTRSSGLDKKEEDVIDALLEMQANDSITMTAEHMKAMLFVRCLFPNIASSTLDSLIHPLFLLIFIINMVFVRCLSLFKENLPLFHLPSNSDSLSYFLIDFHITSFSSICEHYFYKIGWLKHHAKA